MGIEHVVGAVEQRDEGVVETAAIDGVAGLLLLAVLAVVEGDIVAVIGRDVSLQAADPLVEIGERLERAVSEIHEP